MKRLIVFLFILIASFNLSYAFDIMTPSDVEKTYFSDDQPNVKIKTSVSYNNFSVSYTLLSNTIVNNYTFSSCDSSYCGTFNLIDLMNSTNTTFVGSKIFTISVGSENRTIYFDLENPTFTLNNYTINPDNLRLNLNFSYSDNSNLVDKVEVYKKVGSTQTLLNNVTNTNYYSLNLSAPGTFDVVFKVTDLGGNILEKSYNFNITDIFKPQIVSALLSEDNGKFDLTVELKDYNLSKYELSQGDVTLTHTINGTNFKKTIELPFSNGTMLFKVYDKKNNYIEKSFTLSEGDITATLLIKHLNGKTFSVRSNSNNCQITGLDGSSYSQTMTKNGDVFSAELSITNSKSYDVKFKCDNGNLEKTFEFEFVYDTEPPTKPVISVEANEDGGIDITWEKAVDSLSEVTYKLFNGNDLIYEGNELEYVDDDVEYPDEYTYYVQAVDSAKNTADSDEINIIPKKVIVEFETNLIDVQTFTKEDYTLKISTERNVDIIVEIVNNNEMYYLESFSASEKIDIPLKFRAGLNEVKITVEDELGNEKEESFFVTYDSSLLSQAKNDVINPVVDKVTSINESVIEDSLTEEPRSWFWTIFWIAVIVLLVVAVLFFRGNTNTDLFKDNSKKRKKSKDSSFFRLTKKSNDVLGKDLHRIKQERIERQLERQRELERQKAQKEKQVNMTRLEKQKKDDLARADRMRRFSPELRKKSKERSRRIISEVKNKESRFDAPPKKVKGFFTKMFTEPEPKKDDPLTAYVNKVTNTKSWSSPQEYRKRVETRVEKDVEKELEVQNQVMKEEKKPVEKINMKEEMNKYMDKRKKKKSFFFTEREVDKDIENWKD